MTFLRQLRLLLWKNGLAAVRRPVWTVTLLGWPLVVFVIIAVTRHQFPPIVKNTCYAGTRNLPSAGFFPFLQTLMCNTDSTCHNKSSQAPTATKSAEKSLGIPRSDALQKNLIQGGDFFNIDIPKDSMNDPLKLAAFLNNFFGSPFQGHINNVSFGSANTTFLENQETLDSMFESVNLVKKAMCTMTLPMINTSSSNPLAYAIVTFCKSNNTVFEVSLITLNQILTNLVLTKPNEIVTSAGMSMLAFGQLQNQTSLWESLLAIPQLFSSSSDQALDSTKTLLANLQGAMQVIQSKFPEAGDSLSNAYSLLVGGVNMIHYVQNWPGKDVSIPLGEVVTLQNDSLSGIMKQLLQDVQIPLDKAIGLILDKEIVHSYLCDNSSNSILLSAACGTGTVDMVLGWISPEKVAKQVLLAWSRNSAPQDVAFVREVLHSLTGSSSPGGQGGSNNMRRRRSVETQPQSIEEELILTVGEVVMEIIQIFPEADMMVQSILRTGFEAMRSATLAIDTVEDVMFSVLQDANRLQLNYLTLLTNQTEASIWTDRILDSVTEMAMKSLSSESLTCEDLMGPFEWLLNTESIKIEVWRSMICQSSSTLQQGLLMDWQTLIQQTQAVYSNLTNQADYNLTIPMILAEWQNLVNSSVQFQVLYERLTTELGGGYWMNWMPDNDILDVTESLQQSLFLFIETFGENIERSNVWPGVKNYFHIVYWILNYRPGVTTQPANCSINNNTMAICCDTGLNWTQFVEAINQALMSPNEALMNCLEGALNLLHRMYGGISKDLTVSYLKQEIEGGDVLSAYLVNLTRNLDGFFQNVSTLSPGNISNPNAMLPLISKLLQPTCLTPLLPLLLNDAPINVSTVLDIASKFCMINQPNFAFNETDPAMLHLEQLIMKFLSFEGNITLPLSHIMGYSLLNYSDHFNLDDVALLRRALQPFKNQTSASLVDSILSAMELLKTVMDSPDDGLTNIILVYIRQLQELLMSLFRLQKIKHVMLPSEQLNITDVNLLCKDIMDFLTSDSLQNLTQAGPDAAQNIVIEKILALLPPEVQHKAARFLQDFKALEYEMAESGAGQNWLTGVSEMFTFLNQILEMLLFPNANITFQIAANNSVLEQLEFEEIISKFFSLFLSPNNTDNVERYSQALHFINLIRATPNISVSDIRNALEQSNLTIDELKDIAALAGAVNISDLMDNIMEITSARQCLETKHDLMATAQCVMGMTDGFSSVLMQLPDLRDERDILNLIPLIINRTISDIVQVDFSSSPNIILINTLYRSLANINTTLQMNHLNTPEIMNEIKMVHDLIQLFDNAKPFNNNFNSTFMMDPYYAENVYLEIVDWYLKRLENITSNSSVSELLHPFFYLAQMQVTLQLAEANYSSFVINQVEILIKSLQYPIDGAGVSKIGDAVVEILMHLFDLINFKIEVADAEHGSEPFFNTTILKATEDQIKQYIELIQMWLKQPNVSLALTSILQWGNSSTNVSTHVTDIQQLLETANRFLTDDQLAYLSVIDNITQSLSNALTLAEQSGLQSDEFLAAILEAVQSVMQILTRGTNPLPVSSQQDILEIVGNSLKLIVQQGMSFPSPRNISFWIFKAAESVIQHMVPDMYSDYLIFGIKVATTYLESISASGEPGSWNQLILNEMQTVQDFLPPNCTAQSYVSVAINITHFILESGQEITNLWSSFGTESAENMSIIIDQMGKSLNTLWPFIMGGTDSLTTAPSLGDFAYFAPALEQVMTGKAGKDTWDNLQTVVGTVLSTLQGTELWENVSSVIQQFENIIGNMVMLVQAENAILLSFEMPMVTLMREIAHSVNTSHFNMTEVAETMQLAIERTANGTLECSEVLKDWEQVREAAGLSYGTLAMWCNITVEPGLEAIAAAQTLYSHLNMNHMGVGSVNASDAAARIVNSVQSLYEVSVNRTLVTEQLITDFSNQLSMLFAQPLSPEAQFYWNKQLLDIELQNSFSSISLLLDELVNKAPFLQPYINATKNVLHYILNNYRLIEDSSSSQNLFNDIAMIFLTSANTTLDNIFSMTLEDLSGFNDTMFTDMIWESAKLISGRQLLGDAPVVYQALEQFLASNKTCLIGQRVAKMFSLLASTQGNITLDNIFSVLWGNLTGLNDTTFTDMMRETVKLLSEQQIFGDSPMVYQTIEQFLESNDTHKIVQMMSEMSAWLASIESNITSDNILSIMRADLSGVNEAFFTYMKKKAVKVMSDLEMFGDDPVVYQGLEQLLELNDSSLIAQKVAEMAWLVSIEGNFPSHSIISMMWGNISGLNGTSFTNMMREAVSLLSDLQIFGHAPMLYQGLEQILGSSNTSSIVQKVVEMSAWLATTEGWGLDLLAQALPKVFDILRPLISTLTQMNMDTLADIDLFEELARNLIAMVRGLWTTSSPLPTMAQNLSMFQQEMMSGNYTVVRNRREAPLMLMRDPMDDFIDLFYINYPAMFEAISVPPTTEDIMETVHMFFTNPDLGVVLKGALSDIPWGLNVSREVTIDAALGVLSSLTVLDAFQMPPTDLLMNAISMLPKGFPYSSLLQNITRAVARESQGNLNLVQQTIQTASELLQTNMTDPQFTELFDQLRSQVCALENTETVRLLIWSLSMEPGQLCQTFLPSLQILVESVLMNMTSLTEAIFQTIIGDPNTYNVEATWTSVFSQNLNFNISSLSKSLNINITSPGVVTIGEMLRNKTAFVLDVEQRMVFDPTILNLLMETPLPNNNNLEILSWLVNLRHCNPSTSANMQGSDAVILNTFCSMSAEQWYSFSLLMARHLNVEKVIYRMVLSEELQNLVELVLQMPKIITEMMNKILPAVGQLQNYLLSIQDLNLVANNEFKMTRRRRSIVQKATFVTLSQALCSNGLMALFGISKLPLSSESDPSTNTQQRQELIDRFKIPQDATPFCTNMYLDMVNTTGGAIAWAFLKPMLMGKILYTPDTPVTRSIMKKANATLQEFANLRKNSEDWIETANYIGKSSEILSSTLPMLQNSLSNSFVKQFIEMQTGINVENMKATFSSFSNMTILLEKNKPIMNQITTLSTLMVNLSSCIKFDRYHGYNSANELNTVAEELTKNRDLYASVIFKLPEDQISTTNRPARSLPTSSTSSLPPKVSYTIRMHIDNAMRTDKVREAYFVKDNHLSARQSVRYNRGFIYLQDTIDRAIIEIQTGQKITEPAVQVQPFPYPCFLRDEYLQAISFVFPLMLMIAWVLFVADFVKKLVQERELRLHEYMKMMGVNPLSHFFAWFLECTAYLLVTIFILTLVLKYGKILPNSDGFILFLYLCDYGLSILAFSYLISSFFDKTYIAGLSGSLIYILCFFPFIIVVAVETNLTFSQKSALSLFAPTCFSYASQYVSRYETQGEGIHWRNSYSSPLIGDTTSFGWLCWMLLIDSILYFLIGGYIRMVFPGKYGIPAPWYFPFKLSFWADLCCCVMSKSKVNKGLLFTNIMQKNQPVFSENEDKGKSTLSYQAGEDFSELPVGVVLHGLSKTYGSRVAIENLNVSFYEGHVTALLGHNGAGKTTTMSLLTGLFPPSSGTIEVYGRDMQTNINDIRKELGVCMQYDVLFDHLTAKEHLLLYGQIKAPHWSRGELHEQVRTILEETGMHAHRHKLVGTLSGGMKRKLSIAIAFIGGSRLVVLDEPTTGVDPCSRRSIWDIVIQYKKHHTIIMSTHHLDEAEVLSDRIAFLERGGLKCCGSPFYLKDKLGQGYKLTLSKKRHNAESEQIDSAELKAFVQAHVPEARLKEAQGGDLVYSLPPFTSSNASSYRSLLTALDSNLDALQLGGYGISDTTLEEVFLQLTNENAEPEDGPPTISATVSDTGSISSFSSDQSDSTSNFGDKIKLTGSSVVCGMALAWQQMAAIMIKRFHHTRRDWKGMISQILLPVLFVTFAMGLGSIKNDLQNYPELELSPALYNIGPSYSFFRNQNPSSSQLVDTMLSFPGIDNACYDTPDNPVCKVSGNNWITSGNSSKPFNICKCTRQAEICDRNNYQPPHEQIPSSQTVYNLTDINVEDYLIATANDFIRNRYGGFEFGLPLPADLQMDIRGVPKNRTLSRVLFNPEGYHSMPAYLNSLNNFILRSNLPADKDPRKFAISVSTHPYFARADDEDVVVQGMLQILVAICILTGYSITIASFAIYEVKEHHSGSMRLQHIAGISEPFYWAVNFFYDMVIYMIPVTLTVCVIAAFHLPAFTDRLNLGAVTLLLVLFGFATFPWMYLLSGVFKDAEVAFITYVCINLFISVNTIMSTSILYFLSQISSRNPEFIKDIFNKLSQAFLIFPQFNFGNGLMLLARINIEVQLLNGYGIDAYKNPYSTDALGWMFISSFIQGVFFFTLRLLLNKPLMRKIRHLICGRKTVPQVPREDEDEDVVAEKMRVSSGAASSDILQVNQLTKVYQHINKKVHAVKRISVGIPAGECFGLLGVNGAGKTTTFKMLTGDVSPTDGTAQIKDLDGRFVDIMECRNQGINIGYCPQVDALDNLLTGEEHLYFYARIRGISKRDREGVVNYLLKRLELNYHRKIVTDGYSCGTRRKLSTALALIGHPQILLLDEPSSGMDPRTKRHLWRIISEEVKGKCAVILTSHSMEECEALCSRLAIMVKGQFRCLGSLQHIKSRFGSGFTVKMYLAEASCDAEAITSFMQCRFPSTYLKDQHSNMMEYHIPLAPGGVADIFDQLESNKNTLQIKHFSVSQTTLDEVFINFAMGKIVMETIPIHSEDESDELDSIKAMETEY